MSEKLEMVKPEREIGEVPARADEESGLDTCVKELEPRVGARRDAQVRLHQCCPQAASG